MADERELFEQVSDAVRVVLNVAPGSLADASRFRTDLGAESIDFLDISFEVEKRTGVELNFPTVLEFVRAKHGPDVADLSVGDLVAYLAHVKDRG